MGNYTVVGIDFGTSTTVVKVRNYYDNAGTTPPVSHSLQFQNSNVLPTLVFEDGGGQFYFGKEALLKESDRAAGMKEGRLYENFKMKLVSDGSKEENKAKELTQKFFKHIYSRFNEVRADLDVQGEVRTYVSYPVKWDSGTKRFMIECAEKAGFTNVSGEDEAQAAIYASIPKNLENLQKEGIIRLDEPVTVMMLDMGAGTSDIAIFGFKIGADRKLSAGNTVTWPTIDKQNCGGREIEGYLAEELTKYITKISKKGEVSKNVAKRIKDSVKGWKEDHLSPALKDRGSVGLPLILDDMVREKQDDEIYENIQFEKIDRQRFESITGEHWKQLRELIAGALRNASEILSGFTGAGSIDLVILTGGHSKWYGVSEFIMGEKFVGCETIDFTKIKKKPARLLQEASPQETVALGLVKIDEIIKNGFDLKPTMSNSVWIQYKLIDQKSELIPIIQHNAVLPVELTHEHTFMVVKSGINMEDLYFGFRCYYGTDFKTATYRQIDTSMKLNNFFGAVIKSLFLGFLGTETYKVTIKLRIMVHKNGTMDLDGTIESDSSYPYPFSLKV
jgi:molecular chaperone DnaK (HSP70)